MNFELKMFVYNNIKEDSETILNILQEVDFYGDSKAVEKVLDDKNVESRVIILAGSLHSLDVCGDTIQMAEWNERLMDKLRALWRFCMKNNKNASNVSNCLEQLENIVTTEI